MFVRYVSLSKGTESHCLRGVFHAALSLEDRGQLNEDAVSQLEELWRWFNLQLPVPYRFSRSRRRHAHSNAICWFKPNATDHIGKVRELASLLEQHGIATRRLRTQRPGYIVYEDQYQIAAVPFRDTNA
jgi:hypothetical protein